MSVNYNPSIVTNGLALAIDAGNVKGFDTNENLFTYSEEFDNAIWLKQNGFSITPNTATAPDGTLTADTASRDNLAAEYLFQAYGGAGTFTLSCWVRTVTGTATFNMFTYNGIDGTLGLVERTATTTWQRFSTTATVTTASNWYPCIPITSNTQFYIWGAQLEKGITVSDYYKTTVSVKNRGTTLIDLSGNGNNGELTNGPTYNSSNGGSILFDGSNDYTLLNNTNIGNFGTNNFTVSAWCKSASGSAGARGVISKYEPHSSNGSGWFIFNNDGQILARITQDISAPLEMSQITASVSGNTWYNLTITRDANKFSLFINGQLYQQNTTTNIINCSNSSSILSIGAGYRYTTNGATGYYYLGNISLTSIYNRALSSLEIQQNFSASRSRYGI